MLLYFALNAIDNINYWPIILRIVIMKKRERESEKGDNIKMIMTKNEFIYSKVNDANEIKRDRDVTIDENVIK